MTAQDQRIDATYVAVHDLVQVGPQRLDLLIVVDDTAAMAPYQDRLAMLPAIIDQTVDPHFDLRIAVVTSDGVLRRATAVHGPFIESRLGFDLVRTTNVDGSVVDALAALIAVGTTRGGPSQPLAAQRHALDGDAAFLRDRAALAIVTVTATDDASPGSVDEHVAWLNSRIDRASIMVSGIYLQPAPRLDAFHAAFVNGATVVSLADGDHAAAIEPFGNLIRSLLPGICWAASDVEPETPGAQYDCALTAAYDGAEHALRPCRGDADPDPLCWRFISSQPECKVDFPPVKPAIAGYHLFSFNPRIHGECVVLYPPAPGAAEDFTRSAARR